MMRKLLLLAAVCGMATACVDQDFDLSKLDTEDIGVGSDESIFRLPLANIQVKTSALEGVDTPLSEIFGEADIWTPSSYDEVNLEQLTDGTNYLNTLLATLLDEVASTPAKRRAVATLIGNNKTYAAALKSGIQSDLDAATLINDHYEEFRPQIEVCLKDLASKHLRSLTTCINSITVTLNGFGIDDDTIHAFTAMEDRYKLAVYGDIFNRLPIKGSSDFGLHYGDDPAGDPFFTLPRLQVDFETTNEVGETPIDSSVLKQMNSRMTLLAEFALQRYYPRHTVPASDENAITLTLKLLKTGGLNFGDL